MIFIGEMVQVWGLQVNRDGIGIHTKIFMSGIVEKEQHYVSDTPKALNESIIHSYAYFKSNPIFRVIWKMSGLLRSRRIMIMLGHTHVLQSILHLCNRVIFLFDLDH